VPAIDPGQTVTREIVIQRLELQPVITRTTLLPLMVRECGASTPCMLVPFGQGNR
jgi:hypothetical protein